MRPEPTPEQREAIHAGDRRVAVVAGAGTGKTRVLTERYLHLVLERGVALERILALTFTDKAAREMKDRIRKALRERGRVGLARAAEFAPISTIHSFLARVLRERALDAGLDPRFTVADEMTAQLVLEEALEETLDGLDEELRAPLVDLAGGEETLLGLYAAARATPFAMEELRPVEPDLDGLRRRLDRFLEECAGREAGGKTGERLDALRALAPALRALDPAAAAEFTAATKGNVAAAHRERFVEGRALAAEYAALADLERSRATGAAVVAALARLDAVFTARKRADGLLDFADLEREGWALLRGPNGGAIAAGFDHLLVDEYQDVSRIQQAILERLGQSCALFGVGDEKQSIYRFRYADAAVFLELQRSAACYPLGGSFRSRPELVGFTNGLFRRLFDGADVSPQDLRAERDWPEKPDPSIEVLAPEADHAANGRRREARALAARLHAIVEEAAVPGLRYRDCALLLRTTTHLHEYERAFADAGVPYVVVKGRGYYAAREVVDLAHLLLLLDDPADGYRAVGVMTSLLCGVPDGDLALLPGEGPLPTRALHARRPAAIAPERWARLQRFGERFERWRTLAGLVPAGDLIETVLFETRFAELLLLERDGRRRYANLKKALREARARPVAPATYARALLEFRERERRESEAPIAAETDEAVKVMTVHASKGLEFPLVAVGDLTGHARGGGGPILAADGRFGFRLRGEDGNGVEPPGFGDLKAWDREQERNERLRLLYVALTRAERHLILTGSFFPRADGALLRPLVDAPPPGVEVLDPGPLLARDRGSRRRFKSVRAAVRRGRDLPADAARDEAAARALLERADRPVERAIDEAPYVAAVADLVEFGRCPRRYRLKRFWAIEFDDPGEGREFPDADEHPRRELGTAFHAVMHEIGPGAVADEAVVRRHLPGARAGDVAAIRAWSTWLAGHELAARLQGERQHREMPFLTRVHGLAVRGFVDLYAPGVPLLLDYKTGREVRAEEYRVQVAVYLAALRALRYRAPDVAQLVYVDARRVVEVAEEPVDDLVARFLAAHRGARDAFAPVPGPACTHCEFRRACEQNGVACPPA